MLMLPSGVVDQGLPNSVWRRELTVWRREINTSHIRIRDSGHLIPQTMPDDLGELCPSPFGM